MRIIFIRHGDPDYVHDCLTEKGIREASLLQKRVASWDKTDFDFYVSPLGRAKQTAEISLDGTGIVPKTLDWLEEFPARIKLPSNDGNSLPWDLYPSFWADKEELYNHKEWYKSDTMQSGDVEEKAKLVWDGIDKLLESYGYIHENGCFKISKHSDKTIVLYCHFAVSMVILSHLLGISTVNMWQGFNIPPTSVTVAGCEERDNENGFFRCHVVGCTKHLAAGGEPISEAGYFTDIFQG